MADSDSNYFENTTSCFESSGQEVNTVYPKDIVQLEKNSCRFELQGHTYELKICYASNDKKSVLFTVTNFRWSKEYRSDSFSVEELNFYCDIKEEKQLMPWLDFLMLNQAYICEPSNSSFRISFVLVSVNTLEVSKSSMLHLLLNDLSSNFILLPKKEEDYTYLLKMLEYNRTVVVYNPELEEVTAKEESSSEDDSSDDEEILFESQNQNLMTIKTTNTDFKIVRSELQNENILKTLMNHGSKEQQELLNSLYFNGKISKKVYGPCIVMNSISKHDSELKRIEILKSFPNYAKYYREMNFARAPDNQTILSGDFKKPNPLRVLDLSGNTFTDKSFRSVLESTKLSSILVELHLNSININNNFLKMLIPTIKVNVQLLEISLECNNISGEDELHNFGQAFSYSHCIRLIYLGHNRISFSGAKALSTELKKLSTVQELNLARNGIGPKNRSKLSIFGFVRFNEKYNDCKFKV